MSAETITSTSVDDGIHAPDGVGLTSWADNNPDAFANLLRLYTRPGMTIADVTYGKGVFWKNVDRSLYDLHLTDLVTDGVDCRALPYSNDSLDALVFDPPYRYVEKKSTAAHTDQQYQLISTLRDTAAPETRPGIDGVLDLYRDGITEAARVVRKGGYVFVKCQDTAGDGRQRWVHVDVMGYCEDVGLTPVDLAVVVTHRPPPTRWKIQRSLKKAHSYFIVARKGGFYPFGYRAVQAR